jgi:hypothetical protein
MRNLFTLPSSFIPLGWRGQAREEKKGHVKRWGDTKPDGEMRR